MPMAGRYFFLRLGLGLAVDFAVSFFVITFALAVDDARRSPVWLSRLATVGRNNPIKSRKLRTGRYRLFFSSMVDPFPN